MERDHSLDPQLALTGKDDEAEVLASLAERERVARQTHLQAAEADSEPCRSTLQQRGPLELWRRPCVERGVSLQRGLSMR